MKKSLHEILEGSVEEKMEVVEAIWNSIDENSVPVSDEEIQIVKKRYDEYLQNPNDTIDWEVAKEKLMTQ